MRFGHTAVSWLIIIYVVVPTAHSTNDFFFSKKEKWKMENKISKRPLLDFYVYYCFECLFIQNTSFVFCSFILLVILCKIRKKKKNEIIKLSHRLLRSIHSMNAIINLKRIYNKSKKKKRKKKRQKLNIM